MKDKEQQLLKMIRKLSDVHAFLSNTCRVYSEQGRLSSVSIEGTERQSLGRMLHRLGVKVDKQLDALHISRPTTTHTHTVHAQSSLNFHPLLFEFSFCLVQLSSLSPKVKKKIYSLTLLREILPLPWRFLLLLESLRLSVCKQQYF